MAPRNGTSPPAGTKKGKKTLAKSTKAKGKQNPSKKGNCKKSCVTCPYCSGKGVVRNRKQTTTTKAKRTLPENNHFPYFFSYCAQRASDNGTKQSGKETMRKAGVCWRELNPDQKEHFVNEIKPDYVRKRHPPPSPPPPSSKRKPSNPGPSGSQPKFRKSDGDNPSHSLSGDSLISLFSPPGSLYSSGLFVPGKSFP